MPFRILPFMRSHVAVREQTCSQVVKRTVHDKKLLYIKKSFAIGNRNHLEIRSN